MALSCLDSSAAHMRAVIAAKNRTTVGKAEAILERLAAITAKQELETQLFEKLLIATPALSQRWSKAVAAYCEEFREPIPQTFSQAVLGLGYPVARKLVLMAGIYETNRILTSGTSLNAKELATQAIAMGIASEYLAQQMGESPEMAFAAGLFANIGIPALATSERSYMQLPSLVFGERVLLHEAEHRAVGCSHADTGFCLLTDFDFPEPVAYCARAHCEKVGRGLPLAVALAESFVHQMGLDGGFGILPQTFDSAAFARIGGTSNDADHLIAEITRWLSIGVKTML